VYRRTTSASGKATDEADAEVVVVLDAVLVVDIGVVVSDDDPEEMPVEEDTEEVSIILG